MFGIEVTSYDRKVYEEQLRDFLPDKLVDVHVHLTTMDMKSPAKRHVGIQSWPSLVAPCCTYEDMAATYEAMFPGKKVYPVLMTDPCVILEKGNPYALKYAKANNLPALYCTSHDTPVAEIRRAFANGFCGLKPYLNHSPAYIPADEIRIYDFLTPAHLEVVNEVGGIVMLHIPRSGRLNDPVNLAQLMEIDEKYPNAKVIVTHTGRAYYPDGLGNAFDTLKHSKNLLFDFTANTFEPAMTACIQAVGVKRFMFGSDMPIIKMRMYRVTEQNTYINVVPRGLYGDVSYDPHMREVDGEDITTFMYEELLAFKASAEKLGLSKEDVADVLCNNAARLFKMSI